MASDTLQHCSPLFTMPTDAMTRKWACTTQHYTMGFSLTNSRGGAHSLGCPLRKRESAETDSANHGTRFRPRVCPALPRPLGGAKPFSERRKK
ncbi:hypothetical protein EVAR_47575_1 [Eumeta japonica]|uniref:Uncharacterized protein n=1 Tax=Eumeta variegata TaxID=151549 RepID=A0A4C1WRG2_EUMVA|nr:hypothetical protein EVAR_47554_1 [Eumeta japonica]GBP52920.1 hypothetical protein EVAR_47575_1 [Eumeta japonica]